MKKIQPTGNSSSPIIFYSVLVNFLLTLFLMVWIFAGQSKPSIAYVDAFKLMAQYKGVEDVKKSLEQRNAALEANLDTLKKEVETALAEYEANPKVSAREKALLEKVVIAKQEQYVNYEQSVKEQYRKQDEEVSVKLMAKVNDYIKRYGEAHNYKIILAATQYGNIAYGSEEYDLTDKIVVGLNEEYVKLGGQK